MGMPRSDGETMRDAKGFSPDRAGISAADAIALEWPAAAVFGRIFDADETPRAAKNTAAPVAMAHQLKNGRIVVSHPRLFVAGALPGPKPEQLGMK